MDSDAGSLESKDFQAPAAATELIFHTREILCPA